MLNNAFKLVPLSIREKLYERQIGPVITKDWTVYKKMAEERTKEDPEFDGSAVSKVVGLTIGNTISRIIGKYAATVLRNDEQEMAKLERRLDTYFLYMAAMYQNGESIYSKNSDHLDDAAKDEYMQLVADSLEANIKIGLGFIEKDQDTPNPFDSIEAVLADEFVPAKTLLDMNIKCIAVTKRFLGKLFWYADGLGRNTKHLRPSVLGIWNALMSAMHENYPEHFVVKQEVEAA